MNTLEHAVAPEDVMAFVDGEFSATDARMVQEHLEHCAECALLVEQLRVTSEMLERWEVPAVPRAVEEVVSRKAGEARGWRISFGRFRTWKIIGIGGGAVIAAMLMVSVLTRSRISPPSYEEMTGKQHAQAGSLESQTMREFAADRLRALAEKKRQTAMSESLVANGALTDRVPPVPGVAGMGGAGMSAVMGGWPAQKAEQNLRTPMIARTVSLVIVVKNVESARAAMDAIVERYHGYPATLNANAPEDGPRNVSGSLRIPASMLNSAIRELKALGRVAVESQSGEDVGQQHEDLMARLKTARETEERFQAILQQRTGKISDVLEVEQNIARVRGDIESMEAEQRAMEHRVDFATVYVQLTEVYKAKLDASDSVGTRLHNALVAGYHHAAESVLGFVLFIEEFGPALVIWGSVLAVPVVLIRRRYRKIRSSID